MKIGVIKEQNNHKEKNANFSSGQNDSSKTIAFVFGC